MVATSGTANWSRNGREGLEAGSKVINRRGKKGRGPGRNLSLGIVKT